MINRFDNKRFENAEFRVIRYARFIIIKISLFSHVNIATSAHHIMMLKILSSISLYKSRLTVNVLQGYRKVYLDDSRLKF